MLKRLRTICLGILLLGGISRLDGQQAQTHDRRSPAPAQPVPPTHVILEPSSAIDELKPIPNPTPIVPEEAPLPRFARPEWVIVYITAVYVLISGLTLRAIKRQADTMDTQANDARASNAAAAIVTKATLDAIKEQTVQLERQVTASHDGLRAWIGIEVRENEIPIVFERDIIAQFNRSMVPRPPRFEWEIKNHGQTPAFLKTVEVSNFAYNTPTKPLNLGLPLEVNGFLGAGQSNAHPLDLSDDGLSKCEVGQMFWRVSVKVIYDDAFGKQHDTMFSFHYFVKKETKDPRRTGFYQDRDKTTNYYN
jgi:hypothetical protein